ncbi:thiamine-phosphate synthase family protein, partial [Thermofilum pendens]|uniref:Thiamine-phosphate synthase ThiN domain-containing protein n=1 Tax=Thermofilum pendens (strain DSM 2475 / Hrk 5) TaxID=368408 RepID=A1RZS9_THEPD
MNLRFGEEVKGFLYAYAGEKGLEVGFIDRGGEPGGVARVEGASTPWKVKYLVENYGGIPGIVVEGEAPGKEPLLVILGRSAAEVAEMAVEVARRYAEWRSKRGRG